MPPESPTPGLLLTSLVGELNAALARIERRSRAKEVTEADRREVAAALMTLHTLATAYINADDAGRRFVRDRAGFDPAIREPIHAILRRRVFTFFPKQRGDYRDALWFLSLACAAGAEEALLRGGDAAVLSTALAALCIEGGRHDDRDTMLALSSLHDAARRAGHDPAPYFRTAVEWADSNPIRMDDTLSLRMLLERTVE